MAALAQVKVEVSTEALLQFSREQAIRMNAERYEAQRMAPLLGLKVRQVLRSGKVLQLVSIANGRPKYLMTDNVNAARTTRTNLVQPGGSLGYDLTGAGIGLGIWDGGNVRQTHAELNGRVVIGDPGTGEGQNDDHATHVGGTMIASGVNAAAKGMATAAILRSYGWTSDLAEMAAAAASGMRVSNHSYGFITGWVPFEQWYWFGDVFVSEVEDYGFGLYDQTAHDWDETVYLASYYLPVKSAGNDRLEGPLTQPVQHMVWNGSGWVTSNTVRNRDGGPNGFDSVGYAGTAKNILTVGAVNDVLNYTGPASVAMSSFSCWGPTDDGRIKPDIVGNGVGLLSSVGVSDTAYGIFDGTSMSSPNVTGSMGLLIEDYRAKHKGEDMLASTLKGLVIHTADEAGGAPGPDYQFGWGLMNTAAAAQLIRADEARPFLISEWLLLPGSPLSYSFRSAGTGPLKATIVWTDLPGPVADPGLDTPDLRLVNDLDMRMGLGGTTYEPWVLNPSQPGLSATKGDNTRDNVEQIVIDAPAAGWYSLSIGHKGDLTNGKQVVSLIVSGAEDAVLPAGAIFRPGTIRMREGASSTGGLANVLKSDNAYFNIASAPVSRLGHVASAISTYSLSLGAESIQALKLTLEGRAAQNVTCSLFLYNWNTLKYDYKGAFALGGVEVVKTFRFAEANWSNYVNSSKRLRLVTRAVMPNSAYYASSPFNFKIDEIKLQP